MRERGDLQVLHEPFMYHHYLTGTDRLFPDFTPEPGHPKTYEDIRAMILGASEGGAVFFKNMAYYVAEVLAQDEAFARAMSHAFLLRDPAEAAVSYARLDADFTQLELGHESQFVLFENLRALGIEPLVLTADQLRSDPESTLRRYWSHAGLGYVAEAFRWDSQVPEGWKSVQGWHQSVLQSGAIRKASVTDAVTRLEALGAPYTDYVAHHAPFYAQMRDIANRQAHQK